MRLRVDSGAEPRRRDVEDHGADVAHGEVEVVDGRLDPPPRLVVLDQAGRALERQPGREQALDDRVVQVARDALLVFEQREPMQVLGGCARAG